MTSKSCELDPIPTSLLKLLLPKCLPIITHIVNKSLTNPEYIRDWKTAVVQPLLKKSTLDKSILKNYRPVSNLPFVSKLVERCMLDQFITHCDKHVLIPDFQSAYRKYYSTETSLTKLVNDLLWAMERKNVVMMAVMDLSAAFDTTDHEIFLKVMSHQFGVEGDALDWFQQYLRPRGFKVCVGDSYSTEMDLTFSVPQGSCAGAQLFTAYCSSISAVVPLCIDLNGFADDHSIRKEYNPLRQGSEVETNSLLSTTLGNITTWMGEMRLKMNPDKTEYIQFASRNRKSHTCVSTINCDGDKIPESPCIRYLGADLDSHLSFDKHVQRKCNSALSNFFQIRLLRNYLTKDSCETLVVQLCLSHLDYCNILLLNAPDCLIAKLQRVQNMCAKLVLRKRKFDSSKQALSELHWLPVQHRIQFKACLYVHKCLISEAPEYLKDLLHIHRPRRYTRQYYDSLLLEVPFTKAKTFADRSFSVAGPKLWNSLPYELRDCDDTSVFKKKLKTFLFRKAFY